MTSSTAGLDGLQFHSLHQTLRADPHPLARAESFKESIDLASEPRPAATELSSSFPTQGDIDTASSATATTTETASATTGATASATSKEAANANDSHATATATATPTANTSATANANATATANLNATATPPLPSRSSSAQTVTNSQQADRITTATTPPPAPPATAAPQTTTAQPLARTPLPSGAGAKSAHASLSSLRRPSTPPSRPASRTIAAETRQTRPATPTAHSSHAHGSGADAKGSNSGSSSSNSNSNCNSEDAPMPDAPDSNAAASSVETPAHQTGSPLKIQQQRQQQQRQQQRHQQQHQHQQRQSHPAQSPNTEHYNPSTPYTSAAASLDQHAYMMMALASISAAPPAMSPPPTVTPSQVTLPNPLAEEYDNGIASVNPPRQPGPESGLESFARIEFADSVFQMTTYAVIIGRDQRALEQARRDEKRAEDYRRRAEDNASRGLPPPSPMMHDRSKFSKSYVSEEGGMLGPESDSEEVGRPAKRRKTTSTTGSSKDENENPQDNVISNRQYVSHTPGAAAVDLASLRPSPWHVPFIGIHSPGPNIASKTKAISREHLKIAYNEKEGVFEAIPLHKNGFFCEDVHYKSDKVVLKCGDRLQIKDIDFRFMINGVERGRTGAEEYMEEENAKRRHASGGKEMSFDFEQSHGNGQIQDTSDELSDVDISPAELSDFGGEDDEEEAEDGEGAEEEDSEGEAAMEEDSEVKVEGEAGADMSGLELPKKRGPGRPPKNGVMSKREQRLLKKQQQEMAKKTIPQAPPVVEMPIKRKVGRPRKHPLPEHAGERPEKRKYKPRKPKNEDGAEGSDAERRAREKKEKKARPKSPPLELKIEDYTEGQLQKPNKNYGVLIDETLTAAGPDGLTLKQIYKRICQRYPWFYFHTETKGWESSVRHNLIGNEAFKKDETTNMWSRVPGVELDAGKKRKATSPDRGLATAQAYAPYSYPYNAQHTMPPGPAAPAYVPNPAQPPRYQLPGFNGQAAPHAARPVQYAASPAAPAQPVQPLGAPPPAPTQLPGYGPPPAPARPQVGAPQPSAYSSPYASRPPPAPARPLIKAEDGSVLPPPPPPPASTMPIQPSMPAVAPVMAAKTPMSNMTPTMAHHTPNPSAAGVNASAASAMLPAPSRPVIDPRLLQAVVGLKNGLVENLKKARNPKAEAIVMSALNRCIGLKKEATENDKMEAICIKGIRQVIDGFTKGKSPSVNAASSGTPQPDTPLVFEPKVLTSLNGFKEISVKTLKARLGEGRAEAVTLSAIDRAIGLADASIVPRNGEGETAGNLEGVEQHLMKSIRQLLMGMNQKLQGG